MDILLHWFLHLINLCNFLFSLNKCIRVAWGQNRHSCIGPQEQEVRVKSPSALIKKGSENVLNYSVC